MASSRPSRSESTEQPDPSVPAPADPGPASFGYPVRVSLREILADGGKACVLEDQPEPCTCPTGDPPYRLAPGDWGSTLSSAGVNRSWVTDDPGG